MLQVIEIHFEYQGRSTTWYLVATGKDRGEDTQAIVGKSDHFGRYGVKASKQEITKLRKDEIGVGNR